MSVKAFAIRRKGAGFSVIDFVSHRAARSAKQAGIVELVIDAEHHAANVIVKGSPFPNGMEYRSRIAQSAVLGQHFQS